MPTLDTLPIGVVVAVVVLSFVQVTLQIIALLQCLRTPEDRLALIKRRWIWVVVIAMGEMFGAILWFVAGRAPAQRDVSAPAFSADQRDAALDLLYGSREVKDR